MTDPTIKRTAHAIEDATRALDSAVHVDLDGSTAARALDYLDAIIPDSHPARRHLLTLADNVRRWKIHGDVDGTQSADARAVIGVLMGHIRRQPVEVYTITDHNELGEKLPDYWHESDITVRLVGVSDDISGSYGIDTACGAGHLEPTLVLFQEGLPIAQIDLGILLELASTPPEPGNPLADKQPGGVCSIRDFDCSAPPAFLVGPHHTVKDRAHRAHLAPCAEHLAFAVGLATEAHGSELVEVRTLPQSPGS